MHPLALNKRADKISETLSHAISRRHTCTLTPSSYTAQTVGLTETLVEGGEEFDAAFDIVYAYRLTDAVH